MATATQKRVWGWMAFDWASQPYFTLILTFVFGPYFASVAAESFLAQDLPEAVADARAQSLWSWGQTGASLAIAALAPLLGAIADNSGRRMPWIVLFSAFYVLGAFGLWFMLPDGSFLIGGLIAFAIGLVGAEFATIFVNAMLPDLGPREEVGRLSGTGFAVGYAGGLIALIVMLLLIQETPSGRTLIGLPPGLGMLDAEAREGSRLVGPFTAIWYLVFMVPFFMWVRIPAPPKRPGGVARALGDLGATIKSLPGRRSLLTYLVSSMFYRDSLAALYGFGGTYAVLVLDWSITSVGVFGILGVITAGVFTWLGGKLDSRIGPRPVILLSILFLIAVCIVVLSMSREMVFGVPISADSTLPDVLFYVCGAVIGAAGGVLQASSRSLMVRHSPAARPTEAFGLYALSGKATAFIGPALIGLTTWLTESARLGVAPLIGLFALGLVLLLFVNPKGDQPE